MIRETFPTPETLPTPEARLRPAGNAKLIRYFIAIFAVSILFYPPPFWLVRLASYPQWSRNGSLRFLEFGFTAAGQNADVVIFGDSSATAGIDPSQMSAALGKRVLLLPTDLVELVAVDDMPLQRYMKADKAPQLIVFYFAPWNFDYDHDFDRHPMYDGVETILRHGTSDQVISLLRNHLLLTLQFPLMFYQSTLNSAAVPAANFRRQAEQIAATNGHAEFAGRILQNPSCVIPLHLINRIHFGSVRAMGEKYRTARTKILYFAAPIPACANAEQIAQRAATALPVAPPDIMPYSVFEDDQNYAHPEPAGVPRATKKLTEAVRPLLGE